MKYDPEKCSNCMRNELCRDGLVECIIPDEVDITTDMDTESVIEKTDKGN